MRLDHKGSRADKKAVREKAVDSIIVTVDGLQFDGDETSQLRLLLYSQRMRANGRATIPWVMADNTTAEVTAAQMEQALDLAMEKQGEIWFI